MTEARALVIIAAFGANPARWPAEERAALLAVAARPAVAAALRQAAGLDALLGDWAGAEVKVAAFDSAALLPTAAVAVLLLTAAVAAQLPTRRHRWTAAALAAAIAAVVVLTPMPAIDSDPPTVFPAPGPSATGTSEARDAAAFAYVFTPTINEDALS